MAPAWDHNADIHRTLAVDPKGDYMRGTDVQTFQRSLNARLRGNGLAEYVVATDGQYGPVTAEAAWRAAYRVGVIWPSVRACQPAHGGRASKGLQNAVRHPSKRTKAQLKRHEARMAAIAAQEKGRAGALRYARQFAGKVKEDPPGSNRGGIITTWEQALGSWLVGQPWCGTFVGNCLIHAGVKGVNSRIASVAFIEDDARAGRGPFLGWTTDHTKVKQGDLVVLFGRGVHTGLVDKVTAAGLDTVEGNTASGVVGSQDDGGMVAARTRPFSDVHGYALVRY